MAEQKENKFLIIKSNVDFAESFKISVSLGERELSAGYNNGYDGAFQTNCRSYNYVE